MYWFDVSSGRHRLEVFLLFRSRGATSVEFDLAPGQVRRLRFRGPWLIGDSSTGQPWPHWQARWGPPSSPPRRQRIPRTPRTWRSSTRRTSSRQTTTSAVVGHGLTFVPSVRVETGFPTTPELWPLP